MKAFMHEAHDAIINTLPNIDASEVVFLCIGTDRSTGDSLGPLVGTKLQRHGLNVIGTLHEPCHFKNVERLYDAIPKDKTIIAIDACLGMLSNIGNIRIKKGTIRPGEGVGREMKPMGDYSITGTVNVSGYMEYFVLQNTRLSLVMDMADIISSAITKKYPIENKSLEIA